MSLDEQAEENLIKAIQTVAAIPRPHERERIFKKAVAGIMEFMNWPTVTIEQEQ
jgi:hypothetical protein